jgi:hypothetical protein
MSMRNIALAVVLLVGAGALSMPRSSFAGVSIDIDIAPPVARVEVVPPARVGFVWAPGYWDWRGHQHVWVAGYWMRERPGFHWVPAHWGQRGPHWHFEPGHWAR